MTAHPIMLLWEAALTLFLCLAIAGVVYNVASLVAVLSYGRGRPPVNAEYPPVSILKPVRGVDPEAYENFASFCRQDYPEYEIVFGVLNPADPAVDLVRRLQQDFPDLPIKLVASDERIGSNLKVCNLQNVLGAATYDLFVISDSDMRVRPGYLRDVVAYLADPEVGLVTSPYVGVGAHSGSAGLEALGMATDFFPGVAVATQFASFAFGLGSTLAIRRGVLERIGGFKVLADYLADDFQMGWRVAQAGYRVAMSRYVVDTVLPNGGFWPMFWRRLRWMRTARICQPAPFAGSAVSYSTVWALCVLAATGFAPPGWCFLAGQQLIRFVTAFWIGWGVLRNGSVARWWWCLPLSDVLNFVLWVGSWCGNTVLWRGDRFRLTGGGRMVRVTDEPLPATGLIGSAPRS